MKTIAVISQKGGAGKTTLSLHLAVEAERCAKTALVIDLDPQASASAWKDRRALPGPEVMSIQPGRFHRALDSARGLVDLTLVDTAPHNGEAAYLAAKAADIVIVPCRYGFLDLQAIGATADIIERAGKRGYVIFNAFPIRAPRILADVKAAAAKLGLAVAPVTIHQRSAFNAALTAGQTAQEWMPASMAAAETASLYAWIQEVMKP